MKIKLKSAFLSGIFSLLLFFSCFRSGSLTDITKPHLGIYECTEATLGGQDCLSRFSYIHLELKGDETFVLHYQEKGGEKKSASGAYKYDREKETLTLYGDEYGAFQREFPLKKGILTVSLRIGEQTLSLQFEQK